MDQTRDQTYYADGRERPLSRVLWFGLVSGPVIWSILFLVEYLLVEIACQAGILQTSVLGIPLVSLIVIALTVVSLAVVGYASIVSHRAYQQMGGRSILNREHLSYSPARFMALSGLALNILFALLILLMGIPAVVLPPCVE